MTIKKNAIPRASVDIKFKEAWTLLFELLRPQIRNEEVVRFEQAFARYIGAKGAVSFSSGRAATYFGLKALNLKDDDEVLLPAFTFWTDAAMVILAGLKPVFVDVDPESGNIDPSKIEENISPRTKVVFLTHLNGLPADMSRIEEVARRRGLRIFEDCARACGVKRDTRRLGSTDIGMFSFGFGKNLFLFGGGGMLTSNDSAYIDQLQSQRMDFNPPPRSVQFVHLVKGLILKTVNHPTFFGFTLVPLLKAFHVRKSKGAAKILRPKCSNSNVIPHEFFRSMCRVQAKQGMYALLRIDSRNKKIMNNSHTLRMALEGSPGLHVFKASYADSDEMLFFSLHSRDRERIKRFLFNRKIEIEAESATNLSRDERFMPSARKTICPNAAGLESRMIFLPCHPGLKQKDLDHMIKCIKEYTSLHQNGSGIKE
ncbi:MAG: DegT/DnrJ/EryC1/StrS family aminotransferase [Candidatus Aminicenantes bacterium]|nr:DegT/DnrJ/EryC1/StrS family aminotransferase [Candidatus Aminicenantes bacterium]